MSDFSARAETELRISDDYLEANFTNPAAVINCAERLPAEAFIAAHQTVPGTKGSRTGTIFQIRGMSINGARGDSTATTANVNRALYNNDVNKNCIARRSCGIIHPESVRFIYPLNTTARGISVFC